MPQRRRERDDVDLAPRQLRRKPFSDHAPCDAALRLPVTLSLLPIRDYQHLERRNCQSRIVCGEKR